MNAATKAPSSGATTTRSDGARALVIGNSDGIGLALTKRLLGRGYRVTGISRSPSSIEHGAYDHVVCNVTSDHYPSSVARALEAGPLDLCVFCVGVGELLDLTDWTHEARVFRTNLLGLVDTTSAVLPAMRARGTGHFVGLSSIADRTIGAEAPSYAASKAAMSSYLAGLALALRPHGVTVSTVRFGFVDTKMAKGPVRPFMMSRDRAVRVIERVLARRPIRRSAPLPMAMLCAVLGSLMQCRVLLG